MMIRLIKIFDQPTTTNPEKNSMKFNRQDNRRYCGHVVFLLVLLYQNIFGGWRVQNPLPTEAFLLSVYPISNDFVIAGGLGGTVVKSADGGKTFIIEKNTNLIDIRGFYFRDTFTGWLIDSDHLMKTNDGGKEWREISTNADLQYYYFFKLLGFGDTVFVILKPRTAIVTELIHATTRIMKSTDAGNTWQIMPADINGSVLGASFLNEHNGFLHIQETISINESHTWLYQTKDGGMTWVKNDTSIDSWSASLYFLTLKKGFAGRWMTVDGGRSWTDIFSLLLPREQTIDDMAFADSLNGWAISRSVLLSTHDGGNSWSTYGEISSQQLTSIKYAGNQIFWIVGWGGEIFRLNAIDGRIEACSKGNKNILNDVFFIDKKIGWAVGEKGTILRTINGGNDWAPQDCPVTNFLFKVKFLSPSEGWIAGDSVLLHTIDGGMNWIADSALHKRFIDIDFFDRQCGMLITYDGFIYKTSNGGNNWSLMTNIPLSKRLMSIGIVNDHEAWIGGWQGLAHTMNKGESFIWSSQFALSLVTKIQFVNSTKGFLLNDYGSLLKSSDGGWTWTELPRSTDLNHGPFEAFYMSDENHGALYWGVRYLINVNLNEEVADISESRYWAMDIRALYFPDSKNGWAVGVSGTIMKYDDDVADSTSVIPDHFIVYPNPVSSQGSNIICTLSHPQRVSIKVYNYLGQMVQTIFTGSMNKGDNLIHWNPGDIASGVYLISVHSEETRKIFKTVFLK